MITLRLLGGTALVDEGGAERGAILGQPRRLALLAYLAVARPRGFHRRDALLPLFWPEADEERARNALRQAVHVLRRGLGPDVLVGRGADELGVDRARLRCDAVDFDAALAAGRPEEALALYRGELLQGFHIANAPGFERWLDEERRRLRTLAADAAWALATRAESDGSRADAARWAHRAAALQDDEGAIRRLLALLERAGDRAGAVRAYDEFARRLASELEVEPSAEPRALIAAIRARPAATAAPATPRPRPERAAGPGAPAPAEAVAPRADVSAPAERWIDRAPPETSLPAPAPPLLRRPRPHRLRLRVAALPLLVAAALAAALALRPDRSPAPVLAVGEIADHAAPADSASLAAALPEMLATSLARVDGLQVVSDRRVRELAGQLAGTAPTESLRPRALRRTGAEQVMEGALYRLADGRLRLDVRLVAAADGQVRGAYRMDGTDPFTLVDGVTRQLAESFGLTPPATRLASVTTGSLEAYQLYQRGLRSFYEGDPDGAYALFTSALAEDPEFAMAAFYASRAAHIPTAFHLASRAVRLADRASDQERLLIRGSWAAMMDEPSRLAIAETLAIRYPQEPDGHYLLGTARVAAGDFTGALAPLRRVVAMDSLALRGLTPRCRACDALWEIHGVYHALDSLAAAEREIRRWLAMQPQAARPWDALAFNLEFQGRWAEALAALDSARAREPGAADWVLRPAGIALRRGDFATTDSMARDQLRRGSRWAQEDAAALLTMSLRNQGRYAEALASARQLAAMGGGGGPLGRDREALVLLEMGRSREAAALFAAIADAPLTADSPARNARHRAWMLTHAAAAHAALGDTAALRRLADTVQALGRLSAYARDQRLHHHVRGLLLQLRGDHAAAAAELRRALFSPMGGYARTNLELARSLLAAGRAAEAVALLQTTLHGPLGASGLWVTRTEVHELLGRAHEAAGRPDSAAVHYRATVSAWQGADAALHGRRDGVRSRLSLLDPDGVIP